MLTKIIRAKIQKLTVILLFIISATVYLSTNTEYLNKQTETLMSELLSLGSKTDYSDNYTFNDIPTYNGVPYTEINNNKPQFNKDDIAKTSYEEYSKLDYLGRCGIAEACLSKELFPTTEREDISNIHPSGWQSIKAKDVDGGRLYNRCHLIMYALTGENDNPQNLITGTRSLNVDGMLPFEESILDYIYQTNNHVMYKVTPIYKGDELIARGVQMEAYSVEDHGQGISFNVYCFNEQKGYEINYLTGEVK